MKQRNISILLLILILTGFAFLTVCNKKADTKGVELNLTLLPGTITDSLYVKMNYAYTLSETFEPFKADYRVFVHFWRVKNKEMLLVDDHQPEKNISEWKKGDKINYSRVIFIPRFLDEFDIDFEFRSRLLRTVAEPLFHEAVRRMVSAFEGRAAAVYGAPDAGGAGTAESF